MAGKARRRFAGVLGFETLALDLNQRAKGYAGIYIVLGFWVDGKMRYFIIFGIN